MLAYILILLGIVLVIIAILFLSKTLSPVPFYPTNRQDLSAITKNLVKGPTLVVDLGAGNGRVIFAAARQAYKIHHKAQFIALDINPALVAWMRLRRLFHPNRKHIRIMRADMFQLDMKRITHDTKPVTVYLYVDKKSLARLRLKLESLPKGSRILSYMYEIPGAKPSSTHKGINNLYEYIV